MKYIVITFYFICIFLPYAFSQAAQDVSVKNNKFDGYLHFGSLHTYNYIKEWTDCGCIMFPEETPADQLTGMRSEDTNIPIPRNGRYCIGLSIRDNHTWESISQRLEYPLLKAQCYDFSVDMAVPKTFMTYKANREGKFDYVDSVILLIWGGKNECDKKELLAFSELVNHTEWQLYDFQIQPKTNIFSITLEVFYRPHSLKSYDGYLLIDYISDFKLKTCSSN